MIVIEAKFKDGSVLTLYITTNIALFKTKEGLTKICDGVHNNGGWEVITPIDQIKIQIARQLKKKWAFDQMLKLVEKLDF